MKTIRIDFTCCTERHTSYQDGAGAESGDICYVYCPECNKEHRVIVSHDMIKEEA